jgi:hypothetical protein
MNEQIKNIRNTRIREIVDECVNRTNDDFGMVIEGGVDLEKFAELLVRECIMVCWPGGESDILYEQASAIDKAFIDGQDACVERLKQYFGVK